MRFRDWWMGGLEKAKVARRSADLNEDQVSIEARLPELAGLDSVEGAAYSCQQFLEWNCTCTVKQASEVAGLIAASSERWRAEGLLIPYWGDLWVLRRYQASSVLQMGSLGTSMKDIPSDSLSPAKTEEPSSLPPGEA